ncbi:sugar ABC transporter ATP-binding protein [Metasolibacillus meyeri]|uniref:sugar ABC transporter ATP-binding protein n=1 Tax=Metasolibacillus meyeri TaxID=1071052 RepID=UPI000D30F4BD|nr:sugar ABC transporter ATP-binding protein [Metasolibacillus meyeri]
MSKQTIIEMKGISIEFPGVKALNNVDFTLQSGTIHAVIGANGAGKSTLMKILSGAYPHYTGEIYIDNQYVTIEDTKKSKELGIDIVYQEVDTALIPYLTVAENIMLDHLVFSKKSIIKWQSIKSHAKEVLKRMGINMDVDKKVQDISLAEKQMILIARALIHERKFLILDEPTAPLSQTETDKLFSIVRDLVKNHELGVVFISHRIPELFSICEKITIMKDGEIVNESRIEDITPAKVIESMLGKTFYLVHHKQLKNKGDVILKVTNLVDDSGLVNDVTFTVDKHEIVGVAGLVGAGKTELCKAIFGMSHLKSGTIELFGEQVKNKSPYYAVKNKFGLIPEERRKEGIFVEEPIYKNLSMANLEFFAGFAKFIQRKKERNAAQEMIKKIGAKTPNEYQKVANLSGGNQQKIAIGKWLMTDAEILMFDEPTKGVDVGAKGDIFKLIDELATAGKGIIYATSELNEALLITDRIYVMYDGKIVKELMTSETSEDEIMYYATGGDSYARG